MLPSVNQQTTSAGEVVEKREPSYTVGGNADWCGNYGKNYEKMELPYDPTILLLGIYPKKSKTLPKEHMHPHYLQ